MILGLGVRGLTGVRTSLALGARPCRSRCLNVKRVSIRFRRCQPLLSRRRWCCHGRNRADMGTGGVRNAGIYRPRGSHDGGIAMTKFTPFADDAGSTAVGKLTIENGTAVVSVYGSLDITRDKVGL